MDNILAIGALGLALHVSVGVIIGRVIARLAQSNDHSAGQTPQWKVYALGLLVMIVYGFAAGHLAKALREHDAILVTLAITMLVVCAVTYLRRRRPAPKS